MNWLNVSFHPQRSNLSTYSVSRGLVKIKSNWVSTALCCSFCKSLLTTRVLSAQHTLHIRVKRGKIKQLLYSGPEWKGVESERKVIVILFYPTPFWHKTWPLGHQWYSLHWGTGCSSLHIDITVAFKHWRTAHTESKMIASLLYA